MSENLKLVKELRDKTGAGFLDCKLALKENNNNIEKAVDTLRKKGLAKANKKSSRSANEGAIGVFSNNNFTLILKVNSETDFSAKSDTFLDFIDDLGSIALKANDINLNIEKFLNLKINNKLISDLINEMIAKIGENIILSELDIIDHKDNKNVSYYVHNPYRKHIGKIISIIQFISNSNDEKLKNFSRNICMHIAALKPISIEISNLDPELINKEKLILKETINTNEKNENIIENILNGKIKKYYEEVVLNEQKYIIDNKTKIKDLIFNYSKKTKNDVKIIEYKLYVLGNL